MMPNQISISLSGASSKLQTSFPEDPRADVTIIFNQSTQFKLRKAYLKCWSKYFEKNLPSTTQKLQIKLNVDSVNFTKVLSIFYGYTQKIGLQELPQYLTISSYLEIKQLEDNIRNHIMAYHQQFDSLGLFQLSVKSQDQQLRKYILEAFLNKNFQDVIKRKKEILNLSTQEFKQLAEYISKNIQKQSTIKWIQFNNILKEFATEKGDQQLYTILRDNFINVQQLSSNQFSSIFSENIKIPPAPRQQKTLKWQLSQLIENKSVFYNIQIPSEYKKTIEKTDKNKQKLQKLMQRINKLQEKNHSITQMFGKTSIHIGELKTQFVRLNSRKTIEEAQLLNGDLCHSQSKPFIESTQFPKNAKSFQLSQSAYTPLNQSSLQMQQKISSQQPLTFSMKPQTILEQQQDALQKILGFDCLSRGYLKQIFKSSSDKGKQHFYKSIEGKEDLVFLIDVFEDSKNIGIYTSAKINTKQKQISDEEAFIFSLNHNMKFRSLDASKSIKFGDDYLISFSDDIRISNQLLQESSVCNWPATYEGMPGISDGPKWLVGNSEFYVTKFEVYEIIRIQIKMDMEL